MARHLFLALALGAAVFFIGPSGFGPTPTYAQGCMSQGEARAAVKNGQAAPFSKFVGRLRSMGDVVSSCLGQGGGGLVYYVTVVEANGKVTKLAINAKTGQ